MRYHIEGRIRVCIKEGSGNLLTLTEDLVIYNKITLKKALHAQATLQWD